MTTKSPSSGPSESISGTTPTRAAEEALDIGLVSAAVVSLALTYGLVAGYLAVAVAGYLLARWSARRAIDAE